MEFSILKLEGFYANPSVYEPLSFGATSTGLTSSRLTRNLVGVVIRFEDGPGRYLYDATAPTVSRGIPIFDGDALVLNHLEAINLRIIRTGSVNVAAHVHYYYQKRPFNQT